MPIRNNPRHLALVKRLGKALRAAKGELTCTFFLVVDRESKEALLHLDDAVEPEVFKNPRLIARRLKRYKALKPASYADFFDDPKRLVSLAGTVTSDGTGGRLIFTRTVRTGKAKRADVVVALKLFRFLKGELGQAPEPDEDEAVVAKRSQALVQATAELFGTHEPTAGRVLDGFYAHLGSVDALEDAVEALAEAVGSDPSLAPRLAALQEAFDQLDSWDPDLGVLGVQGGLDELLVSSELDKAARRILRSGLEAVRDAWAEVVGAVRGALHAALGEVSGRSLSGPAGALLAGATTVEELEQVVAGARLRLVHHALEEVAPDAEVNPKVLELVRAELAQARDTDPQQVAATLDALAGTSVAPRLRDGLSQATQAVVALRARLQ
ncbi:MAG: hypothetical protein H6732_03215 [Alphaproteobacteria bacterium]|nr:hypothetical protein [Alphaproteobacteria bacterium]